MLWELRDLAPAALVPSAWLATAAVHVDVLGTDGMFIAHVVMASFIAFFAVTGWAAMSRGALRGWRLVLVAGLVVTLAGVAGFLGAPGEDALLGTSIVGWMLLPAAGLLYTGREMPESETVYYAGGMLSVLGAALYVVSLAVEPGGPVDLAAIALVGAGQTAGMLAGSLADRSI
jgi:hypothetical protein